MVGKSQYWNKDSEIEFNRNLVDKEIDITQMALLVDQNSGRPKEKRKIVKMVNS